MALLVPVVLGCSSGSAGSATTDSSAGDSNAPPVAITVEQFKFSPQTLTVSRGGEVTWTNKDSILHTATSGRPGSPSGAFDGSMEMAGRTFVQVFNETGTFTFFCSRHEFMTGEIRVE